MFIALRIVTPERTIFCNKLMSSKEINLKKSVLLASKIQNSCALTCRDCIGVCKDLTGFVTPEDLRLFELGNAALEIFCEFKSTILQQTLSAGDV